MSSAAPQRRLQAVQHNASYLSGAVRRLAGRCDGADPWAWDAQSARLPVAESVWLARSAKAFPAFWAPPSSAQSFCCADGRPRCGLPRVAWEPPVARSLVNTAARARRGCCTTSGVHGRALDRFPAPNFDYRLPPVIITGGRSFLQTEGFNAAITARDVPNLYLFLPCFRNRGPSSSTNQTSLPTAGRWGHVTPGKGSVSTRESEIPNPLSLWAQPSFPENKKENRGSPALWSLRFRKFPGKTEGVWCSILELASFPESESCSGAKSEAKLRKSTKYPGGRRVSSRYTRVLRKIPGILPIWPKIWLILGPNHSLRLGSAPKI